MRNTVKYVYCDVGNIPFERHVSHICSTMSVYVYLNIEVSKIRRKFPKILGSNYRRVGCLIALLELYIYIGMYNEHERSICNQTGCMHL